MYCDFDYSTVCSMFNFTSLENRRNITDLSFLNKIVHNKVNCHFLVNQVSLCITVKRIPTYRTRRFLELQNVPPPTFYTEHRLLCRGFSYFPRVLKYCNENDLYDVLIMNQPDVFKRIIKASF